MKEINMNQVLNVKKFNDDDDNQSKILRIKEVMSKVVDFSKTFFSNKKTRIIFTILSIALVFTLLISFIVDKVASNNQSFTGAQKYSVSIHQRLNELKNTHNYYRKVATKDEMIVRWIEMFSNTTYKNDGNPKYNEYDCLSAVVHYLWKWGSNIKLETIPALISRVELLSKLNQLNIRTSITNVRSGDIVIFKPVKGVWHLGVVWNVTKSNDIQFMDMNGRNAMGFGEYSFNSDKIYKIVEVSYSLWCGDYIEQLNK